ALDLVVAHKTRPGQGRQVSHAEFHAVVRTLVAAYCGTQCSAVEQTQPSYDLVLRDGRIVDGSGSTWYRGDVAIRDGVIVRMASAIEEPAHRTIDLRGQVIAPGFIDIHTHARRGIFERPTAENYVRQGVTMVIEGPDGSSP